MELPDCVIDHIEFEDDAWRKLHNVKKLEFAPRLTVISGLNGIGKSTILGLCANCLGFTGKVKVPGCDSLTYFGTKFQAEFHKLFSLTPKDLEQKGRALIFVKKADETIVKGCNPGRRPSGLRVVSRTMVHDEKTDKWKNLTPNSSEQEGQEDQDEVGGASAKIPFPAIYLGMSRVWPVGESEESNRKVASKKIALEDAVYIRELVRDIISTDYVSDKDVDELSISGLSARTQRILLPKQTFPAEAISLGQGAVGAIVTALASFKKLKRELGGGYPGGLLVIDELDSGLYPIAQVDLVKVLMREARHLRLQIIATSHSPCLLKYVDEQKNKARNPCDKVIFLVDSRRPSVANFGVDQMLQELSLGTEEIPKPRTVYVYTEDKEALELLSIIKGMSGSPLSAKNKKQQIKYCSLNLGNNQIQRLVKNITTPHFRKESVCVLDGDVHLPKTKALIVNLPTIGNKKNPPELEFLEYVHGLIEGRFDRSAALLRNSLISSDRLDREIIRTVPSDKDREKLKSWYNEIDKDLRKKIWKRWCDDNSEACKEFCRALQDKIERVSF